MDLYQIIYLNGPSSSGKSTLAKALQENLDQPFLHIGIDKVIGMMPEKLNNWDGQFSPEGFSWKPAFDKTGHPIHEIHAGPFAQKILKTFEEIVITLAKMNHYIIIDDVSFGLHGVNSWRNALKNYKVLWVGIKAPLELLEQREQERGDRMHGSARGQFFTVHDGVSYDLEFDTSKVTLEKIVESIRSKCVSN